MVRNYAVIGNPIAHSLSPLIHQYFAQQENIQLTYEKIHGDEQEFEVQVADFFKQGGKGLNITLPFKQRAFEMAEVVTTRCQLAGAANTLWIKENQLNADNTDGIGLLRDLNHYLELQDKTILILGAGGAVRGIINPLLDAKPRSLVIANRTLEKAKELQTIFPKIKCIDLTHLQEEYDLIINATSASLDGKSIELPKSCFSQNTFCYDLAYKQKEDTAFVSYVKSMSCKAVDGLGMLVEQAAEAFYVWHEVRPKTEDVLKMLRDR